MKKTEYLSPNYDEGRFFISPILGCAGRCSYCYLSLKNYSAPKVNSCTLHDCREIADSLQEFIWGQHGTIISVGAWGDIFPLSDSSLTRRSVNTIKELLQWGNPVQIMSKNSLEYDLVKEISDCVQFPGQLLYSTTITTLLNWESIEPGTASPEDRLNTCKCFHREGIPTNVLIKPFLKNLAGVEIASIADSLLEYQIDYCIIGLMYWDDSIRKRASNNRVFADIMENELFIDKNHLDCNNEMLLYSTGVNSLLPYVEYLKSKGISTFLKSSCVSSNVLKAQNPSNYFNQGHFFCIKCGNCSQIGI